LGLSVMLVWGRFTTRPQAVKESDWVVAVAASA
jgi:hypothetical protein